MRSWKSLVGCAMVVVCCAVETTGQITWQVALGGYGSEKATCVRQTADGGYVLAGSTGSFGFGGEAYVLKLDAFGGLEWSNVIGGAGVDAGSAIREMEDGTYIVAGMSENGAGYDGMLASISQDGEILWVRAYGGPDWDMFSDLEAMADGAIVVGKQALGANGLSDTWIVRVNSFGDTLWTTSLGIQAADEAVAVRVLATGQMLVAGTSHDASTLQDVFAARLDTSGALIWLKSLRMSGEDKATGIAPLADGGCFLGGTTKSFGPNQEQLFAKLDVNGDSLWARTVGGGNVDWFGGEVIELVDGRLVMAGANAAFGSGGDDAYMTYTDSQGYWVFGPSFGGAEADGCVSVDVTDDGGFVLAGSTMSFGDGPSSVFVIKTDGDTLNAGVQEVFDPLGLFDVGQQQQLILFPNPTWSGSAVLRVGAASTIRGIVVYDHLGRESGCTIHSLSPREVSIQGLATGVYCVVASTNVGICTGRLVAVD